MMSFTQHQKDAIRSYTYKGGDSSPTYKYLLSPFAQYCVDTFTPSYVAPNLITIAGLLLTTSVTVLILIINPTLGPNCPRFLHLLSALSIFGYQTLDNMDGKQARKTNSSSALGMMFDHTCDVINTVVMGIMMGSAFSTGWSVKLFICIYTGFVTFYFAAWEEFHLDIMILPPFNGPSEGLLMMATCSLISFCWGSQWWQESAMIPILLVEIVPFTHAFILARFLTFSTALYQVVRVLWTLYGQGKSIWDASANLIPFLVYIVSVTVWLEHSTIAFPMWPLLSFLVVGSVFCELTFHMMLTHIFQEPFRPFTRYTAYMTALLPVAVYLYPSNQHSVELSVLLILACVTFPLATLNIYSCLMEFAATLDIDIFTLRRRCKTK